jgi:hypothetical protein
MPPIVEIGEAVVPDRRRLGDRVVVDRENRRQVGLGRRPHDDRHGASSDQLSEISDRNCPQRNGF